MLPVLDRRESLQVGRVRLSARAAQTLLWHYSIVNGMQRAPLKRQQAEQVFAYDIALPDAMLQRGQGPFGDTTRITRVFHKALAGETKTQYQKQHMAAPQGVVAQDLGKVAWHSSERFQAHFRPWPIRHLLTSTCKPTLLHCQHS